jgi:hypothetical protein
MRRSRLWLVFLATLSACAGQAPPPRAALPNVAEVVEEALPCGFLLGNGQGVSIEEVVVGGAADGVLESGDLLVGLDGADVSNADQLRRELSAKAVGQEVSLEVVRNDEPLSLEVVLASNPDDPERPLLGVMIETAYERVTAADLSSPIEGGRLVRAASIGGKLYLLDPQVPAWGSLGVDSPPPPWAVVGGGVYVMEEADTAEAALLDVVSNDRIVFDVGEWQGSRLLGSLGDRLLISASRPAPGQEDLFQIALMLIDLEDRNARWVWVVDDADLGIPVVTFPSPDGTRVLVAGQGPEDEVIRYAVLSSDSTVQLRPSQLRGAENWIAVGWFDDRRVLMRDIDGGVSLLEISTGILTPATLPATVGTVSRAWAVGDGGEVLADTGTGLIRFSLGADVEVRILADNCEVELLGDIGWSG